MLPFVENLSLVDHHCHGLLTRDLSRPDFERMLTESDEPAPAGTTLFDSHVGFAVRRWCAPVLDLAPHSSPEDYLARRGELGVEEVNRRFLRAAGIGAFCVDAGYLPEPLMSAGELAVACDATGHDILRLERLAETLAVDIVTGQLGVNHFADTIRERIAGASPTTVGLKSVAAYRVGLALPAARPTDREVTAAVRDWMALIRRGVPIRLANPLLHAFLIWTGVDAGLPIQIHVGYGDADLDLDRCNPLLLTGLLRALAPTGVPVMLLHCYPYHREAGYLAQILPTVHMDVGLALQNLGRRAPVLLGEALELVPFSRFLFSTDAFGLGELYLLGSLLFRRALSTVLADGIADGDWTEPDATRLAEMIGVGNARRVYRLDEPGRETAAVTASRLPAAAAAANTTQPAAKRPERAQPTATQPEAAQPEGAQPEETQPEETQPAPAQLAPAAARSRSSKR
ncbi:amidohydrolase family protein [Frankia sp. R43]|uniref:amidohydrolase family protein n=1 Tax=Frankia sp. R43 TaxID=269536 RepID=UPI001F39E9E3|nr:amidohydrolase family protein [Frankia sp. R43]